MDELDSGGVAAGGGDGRELDECGGREAFVLVAADPCGLVGRGVDGGLFQTGPDGRQGPEHGLPGGVGGGAGAVLGADPGAAHGEGAHPTRQGPVLSPPARARRRRDRHVG
ncbi:hypothetical protein [Streptomyces sp. NPDC003863]